MKKQFYFIGVVKKFRGYGGWIYVEVPKKHTLKLKKQRRVWGMYPIKAYLGKTSWKTKLMMKKGGNFFIALKKIIRNKEKISVGNKIAISFNLIS